MLTVFLEQQGGHYGLTWVTEAVLFTLTAKVVI